MTISELKEGGLVLARHIPAGVAWGGGLKFFSQDAEYIQVGTWGYNEGMQLLAHTHNLVPREIEWTKEVLYVRKGSISANIYDSLEKKVATLIVHEGDILILLRGGHGYVILEDGTEVLEIKNGPYPGAEADRRRLQEP